jgi:hypothetical protein
MWGATTSTASSAAGSDAAAATLLVDYQHQRDDGQSRIARSPARAARFAPGCENATRPTVAAACSAWPHRVTLAGSN